MDTKQRRTMRTIEDMLGSLAARLDELADDATDNQALVDAHQHVYSATVILANKRNELERAELPKPGASCA